MTTTTAPALPGVSFGGILVSEWIKLRSLRSTVWCYAILVALTLSLAPLFAWAFTSDGTSMVIDGETTQFLTVQAVTVSVGMSQLVASVLGVLIISGEYGTGMIRSTLTAVPTRLPALFGKALVFGVITFVLSFVSMVLALLLALPVLAAGGIEPDLSDSKLWLAIVGAAGYLVLIGLLSLAIGAIIRHSAGGIAATLGLILVVPTVVSIFAAITRADWAISLSNALPSNAGSRMYAYVLEGQPDPFAVGTPLDPAVGALVLGSWVVVSFVLASVLLKRRDA